MKKLLVLSLLAALVAGCATSPDRIQPLLVSHDQYMGNDCSQLDASMSTAQADLKKYSDLQDAQVKKDAVSVFWVLIPLSWFTGDHEKDVARSKGELAAIQMAAARKGCTALHA